MLMAPVAIKMTMMTRATMMMRARSTAPRSLSSMGDQYPDVREGRPLGLPSGYCDDTLGIGFRLR